MNEIEIEKQSFDIQEVVDNVIVCDDDWTNVNSGVKIKEWTRKVEQMKDKKGE